MIVAKEYVRIITGSAFLYMVSRLFDDDDEEVPVTSSDFAKVVRGETRIDPWGGTQQVGVFGARVLSGTKTGLSGKTEEFGAGKGYGLGGGGGVVLKFARSKMRPDVGVAWDVIIARKTPGDEPITPGYIAESLVVPLSFRDVASVMRDRGFTEGVILKIFSALGAGVNTHTDVPRKSGPPTPPRPGAEIPGPGST